MCWCFQQCQQFREIKKEMALASQSRKMVIPVCEAEHRMTASRWIRLLSIAPQWIDMASIGSAID